MTKVLLSDTHRVIHVEYNKYVESAWVTITIVQLGVVPTQIERIQLQTTELAAVLDAIADKEVDRAQV